MLTRLQTEHDHILKTLNLLEMQYMDLCRSKAPSYPIMRSIIVYIQEYPEQAHHPLEDALFSLLFKRVDNSKLIQDLISDHTELEVITRKLRQSLEVLQEGVLPMQAFTKDLSMFLTRQRRHVYIEEMEVYPLITQYITDEDWEKIQSTVALIDDPVFGERTRSDYELLYHEIEGK